MSDIINWESIRKRGNLSYDDLTWVFDILETFEEVFNENKNKYIKTAEYPKRDPERYHLRVAHDLKLSSIKLINIINFKTSPSLHELAMYDCYWNNEITKRLKKKTNPMLSNSLVKILKKVKGKNITNDTNVNNQEYSRQDKLF